MVFCNLILTVPSSSSLLLLVFSLGPSLVLLFLPSYSPRLMRHSIYLLPLSCMFFGLPCHICVVLRICLCFCDRLWAGAYKTWCLLVVRYLFHFTVEISVCLFVSVGRSSGTGSMAMLKIVDTGHQSRQFLCSMLWVFVVP